jgi:hypothetical protein
VANWLSGSDTLAKAKSLMKLIAKANNYVRLPDAIPASIFMGNDTLFGAATAH